MKHILHSNICFPTIDVRRIYGAKSIFCTLVLLSIPAMLWGRCLQIAWTGNTESDLSGYRVYYGTSSRTYTAALNVGNSTSVTVDGFLEGYTYYVAVTAYDYSGNESAFSPEVSVTVPSAGEGGGILGRIVSWVSSLFVSRPVTESPLADYGIQDFSTVSRQSVAEALSVVRVGGAASSTPTSIEPAGEAEYVMRDAITMVGEYFDLSSLYPDGTYLFLPLTEDSPFIDNDIFSAMVPGASLYLVADSSGEYLHILRISALDMLYAYSDYEYGAEMYLEDSQFGIAVALSPLAIEGSLPIAIGQNYADIIESSAQAARSMLEFTVVPYGLTLSEPAEIRVAFDGTSAAGEHFDENERIWKPIPDLRVEDGQIVFSAQTLGRFRVYDTDPAASSGSDGGGGGGGGGCFISTCR